MDPIKIESEKFPKLYNLFVFRVHVCAPCPLLLSLFVYIFGGMVRKKESLHVRNSLVFDGSTSAKKDVTLQRNFCTVLL